MVKEIICTVCPRGCHIKVEGDSSTVFSVEGYTCQRGKEYAANEFLHPVRILTSTVRAIGGSEPLLAVRSDRPVPKEMLFNCMDEVNSQTVTAPIKRGEVILADLCSTGAKLIASADYEKC